MTICLFTSLYLVAFECNKGFIIWDLIEDQSINGLYCRWYCSDLTFVVRENGKKEKNDGKAQCMCVHCYRSMVLFYCIDALPIDIKSVLMYSGKQLNWVTVDNVYYLELVVHKSKTFNCIIGNIKPKGDFSYCQITLTFKK